MLVWSLMLFEVCLHSSVSELQFTLSKNRRVKVVMHTRIATSLGEIADLQNVSGLPAMRYADAGIPLRQSVAKVLY